jgi:hypothetical protein
VLGGGGVFDYVGGLPVGVAVPLENVAVGADDCGAEGVVEYNALLFDG